MTNTKPLIWEEADEVLLLDDDLGNPADLVIYNDDHNTFDWVIQCLIEILEHTSQQAEQLSLIIHFKGRATVKRGPLSTLVQPAEALLDRGLSAKIEE